MSAITRKKVLKNGFDKQESLQAIVFASDFIDDLKPVDQVYPSILLPVVTCPLLEFTLDTLIRSKVEQIFLYCSSHLEILKTYLDSLKNVYKNINIVPIISDGCQSLGDALRDIDTKGFIRNDFILIRGTAFGNLDLSQLMDLHKARREKDKTTVMTMILRNLGNMKDSILKKECNLVVSNSPTKKILMYKKNVPNEDKIELELQWFLEHNKVSIDTSHLDTRIYMCSQAVLPLFADNFDFQTMEDFIHGVLINEEFLNSKIYWESLACPSYALPICSKETYRILCRDILQRHSYPLVPDTLPIYLKNFIYMSRSTYKHCSSVVSKGSILHSESIMGKNSFLGTHSSVERTVIGANCKIGNNVCIEDSYIFSDTVIEDYCHIKDSIIFSKCLLKKNFKLNTCILLPNVVCNENYCNSVIEINDSGKMIVRTMEQFVENCDTSFSSMFCDFKFDQDNDNDDALSTSTSVSSSSTNDSPMPETLEEEINEETFLSDVIENLLSGYEDKLYHKNVILEINSSRLAQNISSEQVLYSVIQASFTLPFHVLKTGDNSQFKDYYKILIPVINYVEPIINNYMKTKSAQKDCLCAIRDVICKNKKLMMPYAGNILRVFYDKDILGEEIIIDWFEQNFSESQRDDENEQEEDHDTHEAIKKALLPFITWLKEAEEDSSE
ncbi:translation initiation factor eIF-2B subunit epsilon [Phymastichus coffea]|uniref:translation initiation factor eIF-2B subunit epsilon n=1 Tax=Phymastichus coffea TaxID=108790 RepID=UPI00273B830B|nr:translation initiation factor eIF-2B subunit epsilon [Phymastichus coffea]